MGGQKPEEAHLAPTLNLPTVPDTYIESQANLQHATLATLYVCALCSAHADMTFVQRIR